MNTDSIGVSNELRDWLLGGNTSPVKNAIFSTFHRILDHISISETQARLLILMQFIQLSSVVINEKNPILLQHISESILLYFKLPLIYPFLADASYFVGVMMFIPILMLLIWIVWGFFSIFNLPEKEHRKYGELKQSYGTTLYLLDSVLIAPCFGILIKLLACGSESNTAGSPDCLSTTYFIVAGSAILLIICFFMIVMIVGMFFFNYFFKQRDAFARSSNMMHLVFRLYQICAICVDIFIFDQEQKFTVNLFLHSIFSIIFGLDYYNRLPYYNSTVSRDYCFCVSGYFWINIVLLITHLANLTIIDDNVIYIILIGLCFFLYIVKTFREYFYTSLIIKDIEEIDNEIHLDARFRYLLMISKNSKKDKKYELLLTSIVRVHIEKCKDSTCICKNRELLFDPKKGKFSNSELSIFKDSVFTKNYLLMLVRKSTKKLPRSSLLNIDHFLYLFEELNNIPMVNHQILMYEKQFHHSLFITVQYEIFRMRISILSLLRKKNKGFEEFQVSSLMYENIRRYDEGIEDFRSKCIDIIDNFSRMWDILNDPAPDMKMLENVCMSITDVKEETHAIYERILAVSKTSLEFLSLMKTYTKYVIFDDLLFLEVDDKIQIVKERSINDSVHLKNETFAKSLTTIEETCCSIAISINLENLGQITWNSKSCESTFGYESNYFRTFNVATILPQLIGQMHNKFLDNYFKVGKPRLLKQLSHLWAVDKNKNLFSVLMALKLYIGKEGMTALSLIKKMNDQDYLLLNARGEVFGAGSNVRNILKIPSDIEKRGLNLPISLLCPSLIPLFLEEIYDLPGFAIKLKEGPLDKDQPPQFINKEFFKSCYLFMKSDFEKDAINIADELKTALVSYRKEDHYTAVERYCSLMYKYLSMIQYEDISNISRLDICINKHCFSESLTVWEIKILGVRHVNLEKFNKSIFAKEFAFVEKYQLNALRKKAIDIIFGRNRFSDGTRRKHRESTLIDESTPIRGDHHSRERRRTNMSNSPVDIPPDLSKIRAQRQRRKTRRMSKIENNLVVPKNFVSHQKKEDADNPINSPSNSESKDPDMKESKFANSNLLKVKMRFDGVVKSHKERVGMSHEEQKLDIPIDEAAEVFYNVRDIEEQEYEFLEEPQENNSMAESSDEVNKIEGAKKQANALLVRLKAEYSQGFEMGGSVGSTASKISQRDSMIKIRNSILARRSPLGLLLARGIFVASLVLCLIINITTLRFMTSIYKEISDYSKEVWYLSKLSIGMNKVETYMSYLELVEADFFNTSLVYGVEPIAFFEKDSLRTLENTMVIFDMLMTQSNSFTGHQNTLNVYFSQEGNFSIDSRIYNFKMIDYLIMYISKVSTILSEGLPENRDLTNLKNLNSLAQMEIKAHDQISELRVDLIQRMWLIYLIDLFIRASLIIIGIMIAFPLTYRAAQGSGDVLMQLSKISQINISFYIQHYSKINIYFKSMTSMEDVLDRVSEFYETEFLLKRQRELRSGNNRIARFMKINRSGWVTWVFYGIITFTLVFITQMLRKGLFIFEYDETTKTIPRFQLIPEMANRMIIFNTISSKIMMLRASGIDQAEDISEGFKILKSCTDFMNSSIISLTDVRTDIIDAQFEAKLLTLLDSNVCEEVFSKNASLDNCIDIVQKFLAYGVKSLLTNYETSSSMRLKLISTPDMVLDKAKDTFKEMGYRDLLIDVYYLENSLMYWEIALEEQLERMMTSKITVLLIITGAESILIIVFVAFLTLYVYPKIKTSIIYSLSFLLLVPFHIIKENESFSTFIKKRVNYSGVM